MSTARGDLYDACAATALVVEDNEQVRGLEALTLRIAGLNVIEVDNPAQALELLERPARKIDLLVTDVIMPQISGAELAHAAVRFQPGIRVIFASGYGNQVLSGAKLPECAHAFLEKPFGAGALINLVNALLASDGCPPPEGRSG
jgi:DNA-binding NtrC family response regulator